MISCYEGDWILGSAKTKVQSVTQVQKFIAAFKNLILNNMYEFKDGLETNQIYIIQIFVAMISFKLNKRSKLTISS